jgi:3-oxoacyl-[acyl-carrier-protein] synthase II
VQSFIDQDHPERDVVITGIGMVTPLGIGCQTSWQRLLAAETAARVLTADDIRQLQPLRDLLKRDPCGMPVDRGQLQQRVQQLSLRSGRQYADVLSKMILCAAIEALQHSGLSDTQLPAHRTGCVIGTSKGSLHAAEQCFEAFTNQQDSGRDQSIAADWWTAMQSDAPLQAVQRELNITGPATCPVSACATGLVSVIQAAGYVASGMCDVCLAGSVDSSLTASVMASFHRLGVLSRHETPQTAGRPFDQTRDGFLIGEGAAVFVLESRQHAERRKAAMLGQMVSGGWLNDPTGLTQIDPSGRTVAEVLNRLRQTDSGCRSAAASQASEQIHLNLHGTGTETNDLAESNGVCGAFADQQPVCSAIKGSIGHLLGAAGSVELAFAVLGLHDQIIPPAVNLRSQDPLCDISVAGGLAAGLDHQAVMKLSLGFGGHVAGCLVRRANDD